MRRKGSLGPSYTFDLENETESDDVFGQQAPAQNVNNDNVTNVNNNKSSEHELLFMESESETSFVSSKIAPKRKSPIWVSFFDVL